LRRGYASKYEDKIGINNKMIANLNKIEKKENNVFKLEV